MMSGKHLRQEEKTKFDRSQFFTLLVILFGFIIAQECLAIMVLCIVRGFTATAAWLTAAVGLAEAVIGLGLNAYLSLAKSDHKGPDGTGITYAKAQANGFKNESNRVSPPI